MSANPEDRRRRRLMALTIAGAVVAGLLFSTLAGGWEYRYYDMAENAEIDNRAVETWSLALPAGYRLVRYKSTPPGPQDGYRLFPPN